MAKNALQAVLDRAATTTEITPPPSSPPTPERPARAPRPTVAKPAAQPRVARPQGGEAEKGEEPSKRFFRPSRQNRQLIAGHFPKSVAKQLKLISVEDDTTVQALLEEALDLLFVKKGKQRIADITRRGE